MTSASTSPVHAPELSQLSQGTAADIIPPVSLADDDGPSEREAEPKRRSIAEREVSGVRSCYRYLVTISSDTWLPEICAIVLCITSCVVVGDRNQVVAWKSSPLALLLHGFDQNVVGDKGSSTNIDRLKDMQSLAKSIQVVLERQQDSKWCFTVG